jgi:leader peptidase (prepilin peptidase)/N-methyltransferase
MGGGTGSFPEAAALRLALFGLTGLAMGSFLTVVVHRLPAGLSVVAPRSACPACGSTIAARDNVPVLSYALLRGRCRGCDAHISGEYPAIEAVTAGLFVAAALTFRGTWPAAIVAIFFGVLVAAALIDARHRIIPNRLTYPSLAGLAALIVVGWASGAVLSPMGALFGLLALGGGCLAIALVSPRGMGMGDVKLAGLIGLVLGSLGLRYVAVAAALSVLAGGLGGLIALLAGRSRKDTIPFGPFLSGGAVVAAMVGPQVASWYGSLGR